MKHLEQLIDEYQAELTELEKIYHTLTDAIGNHCDTDKMVSAVQDQIIILTGKINTFTEELEAHNEQFKGEREFDKYDKLNY
jgi:ribosomal protein S15P/S13E